MSWSPLAGLPNPIIVDAAGASGSGYVLKTYLVGTNTSTSLAIDSSGSSPQTSITANSEGKWEVSSNEVMPNIDRVCKWGIFANATDAAANTPFYMGPFDNVPQIATLSPSGGAAANITALKAVTGQADNQSIILLGHTAEGDGGGGIFRFDSSASNTDDNGYYIEPDVGSGRWIRDVDNSVYNVMWWGAIPSASTDISSEINGAIVAITGLGGGTAWYPATSLTYYCSSPLVMALEVNQMGVGEASKITFDDCDGLNFASLATGYGRIEVSGLFLTGVNGTTRKAIVHAGTETATDELYGLIITRNLITEFNEGISFRTVRNFKIDDNWIQGVNSGIVIEGRNIVGRITNNNIVRSSGNGTGNDNGIFLNDHNYTTSGGVVRPEGIIISNNFVGTFKQAINIDDAVFCAVVDNDIAAHIQGISFSTVSGTMSIRGNYINMDDDAPGSSLYGIFGEPQNNILGNVVINIDGNTVVGADTTSCAGVQLATAVTANQANINIVNNAFYSLDTNDIVIYSSGNVNIKGNQCYSNNTTSIMVKGTLAGMPIVIEHNHCVGDIRAPFADTQNAQVICGFNTGTFSTLVRGTTIINNPDTTALTTYSSLRGAIADSGTTDSSASNKLIQSGQNFLTTVTIGDAVHNTTDTTSTYVTAIDSDTQLSINDDIMGNTEAYTIYSGNQVPHFASSGGSASGFEIVPVIQSWNVSAVGNVTATSNDTGITLTVETTPAVSVEIQWEAIMRQKYN